MSPDKISGDCPKSGSDVQSPPFPNVGPSVTSRILGTACGTGRGDQCCKSRRRFAADWTTRFFLVPPRFKQCLAVVR
jgi:hypothetical protein